MAKQKGDFVSVYNNDGNHWAQCDCCDDGIRGPLIAYVRLRPFCEPCLAKLLAELAGAAALIMTSRP